MFANADTDEKLLAFVRTFGPVVAKDAQYDFERTIKGRSEPHWPTRVSAVQDLHELRNEQSVYSAAFNLMMLLNEKKFDSKSAPLLVRQIAANIADWTQQWEREKSATQTEPFWRLKAKSLQRIQELSQELRPDPFLPASFDARIIVCELLNCFPSMVFVNQMEMHSAIKYGIRPLLYSLMRRQFLSPRDVGACVNTQCRNFFNISRAGKKFCSPECSRHQRQRLYWAKSGKKRRRSRLEKLRRAKSK